MTHKNTQFQHSAEARNNMKQGGGSHSAETTQFFVAFKAAGPSLPHSTKLVS